MLARKETLAEGIDLYCGDCREILPTLGNVDHVITDPPYESHMHVAKANATSIRLDGYALPKPVDFASIETIRSTALGITATVTWGYAR